MRKYIFTLLIILFTAGLYAQDSPDSRRIVDKTYTDYISSNGTKLSFALSTIESDGTEYGSQEGEASVKGNKFKLEMEDMDVWFDGKTQWVLMKNINEVNISNPTESELASISPLALLGIYKEGYLLKTPLSKTVNKKSVHHIEMVPANGNKEFKAISISIDKASNRLVQAMFTMNNNMQTKIDITEYNDNYKFSDNDFTFNLKEYPKVEIIDLR